ncbi:MAG: DUF3429 domain-containing protein [Hyphomicrobiales bacterium]
MISDNPISSDNNIPKAALILGLAGVLPFVVFGLLAITLGGEIVTPKLADTLLIGYGAVILSFTAGVRWGLALTVPNENDQALQLTVSTVPSIIAWAACFMPFAYGLPLLAFTHAALAVWDIRGMYNGRGPIWYGKLRMILAIIVVGILVVVGLVRYFMLLNG